MRSEFLGARVTPELKAVIESEAKRLNKSISDLVNERLDESFGIQRIEMPGKIPIKVKYVKQSEIHKIEPCESDGVDVAAIVASYKPKEKSKLITNFGKSK